MRIICLIFLALDFAPISASAQSLPWPFYGDEEPTITTWRGPRIHPVERNFSFHDGVDYSRPFGDPIIAVQGGTVVSITKQGKSGYVLRFNGASGAWSLLHIFNGSALPITLANGWQLKLVGGQLKIVRPILSLAYGVSYSSRVISADPGEDSIAAGEPIAPVGTSGIGTGPHLHLNFNGGDSSPLEFVRHAKGNPTISFINSPSGKVYGGTLSTAALAAATITIRVDASAANSGKDLDKVEILVDTTVLKFPGITEQNTFRFGGISGESEVGMTSAAVGGNGVNPVLNQVFRPFFNLTPNLTYLEDGQHMICARTKNINGDYTSPNACIRFAVDLANPGGSITDAEGVAFPGGIIQQDKCAVFRSSDSASGICSMSLSGPPGFTSISITLPQPASLVAWAAPFCQLSSGTYTLLVTDCGGKTGSYNFTAATKTLAVTLTASGPLGWSDSNSVGVSVDQIQSTNWGFRAETQTCSTELTEVCKRMQTSLNGATAECNYWENCGFLSKVMSTITFNPPWQSTGYSIANVTVGTAAASADPPIVIRTGGASVTTSTPLASGESITGYISVPQTPKTVWRSTITAEIEILAPLADIRISSTPTPADMAAAAQHSLQRQSSPGSYELSVNSATGVFGTTITINLIYLDSVNTDTTTARLFRWEGTRWSSAGLTNQSVAKSSSGLITIIARSTGTSWYAAFFQATDASAPVTTWSIQGSSYGYAGITIVSTYSYLVFSATDPVVNGFNSGLATTYYRIDGLEGDRYTAYLSSIPAPFGTHWVDYYSTDFAANSEAVKRITFTVTAGDITLITEGDLTFDANLLVGFYGSGAKTEVVARAEYDYTLLVSSVDGRAMLAVDNVGLVSIGTAPAVGRLTLAGVPQDTALALRSGNSTASVAGAQLAFGFDGSGDLRHRIYTQHGSAANFNKMVFALWTPASGSSSTLGALPVLSLEGSTITPVNALVHVMPAGVADKELVVSNGSAMGEGDVLRWERWVPSAAVLKKDIKRLGKADEEKAWDDIASLKPVAFRRKSGGAEAPMERGYIYEETPSSIRDGPGAASVDERLVNAELALKAAMRRVADLKGRIKKLKEAGQ